MGSIYLVVSMVTVETVARGFQAADKGCKVFSSVYVHNELANLVRPDQMHIKARLGRVVLATKMATGSLTKTINRVDNGRGLQ
jgi:hypothetical protein